MPAGTLQGANPDTQTVARRAQTTVAPDAYASFVRESRKCNQLAFASAGNAFGGFISKTIKPSPGYLRGLWVVVKATGGVNGTNTVAIQADAPWNAIQSFSLRDAFGSVVYQADGYGMYLIHLYSGQIGAVGLQDPTKDAFYSTASVGSTGTGNFTFALYVPLEFDNDTGYCSLPSMNAAAQMTVSVQLASSATVYSTAPGTLPTVEIDIYQEYWAVPISDPTLTPPDDGSSHQWTQSQGQATIASASNNRIQLPDVGTYLSSIIVVTRDSTNARIDTPYSTDCEFWVDGVPVRIEDSKVAFSRMYREFGITRPTGALVYSFRNSTGRTIIDDNMELLLPTTPGTLLELFSGQWGTFSNSPATVQTYTGKLYPVGNVPEHAI
jgi:hypothetical protein